MQKWLKVFGKLLAQGLKVRLEAVGKLVGRR
jgi:hypothetical protein